MTPRTEKIVTLDEALAHICDGTELMFGGFGGVGSPPTLIDGIVEKGVTNLRLIGNDAGFPDVGIGRIVTRGRAQSLITSHIGSNPNAGRLMSAGTLKVTFYPQGTLAEKIRARGVGLAGVLVDLPPSPDFTSSAIRSRIGDSTFLVEPALGAEVGIVYARAADEYGNLVYDKSARNFNPLVAMAAEITIAEVDEILPLGALDPESIVTPGVYVDYIVKSRGVPWKWAWEKQSEE